MIPNIIAYSDTTIEQGDVIQLDTSGGLYDWTPDFELSCTNCQSPFASPNMTMSLVVKVTV